MDTSPGKQSQILMEAKAPKCTLPTFLPLWSKTSETKWRHWWQWGFCKAFPLRHYKACAEKSPLDPLCSLFNSGDRIKGVTGAYDHFIKAPHKQTSLEPVGVAGGALSKLLCHLSVEGKNNNSWCKTQQGVGPGSDKMGNDRNQLFTAPTAKAACLPCCSVGGPADALSHISIPLFRQHLKAGLSLSKHCLSLEEHTKMWNAGFPPSSFPSSHAGWIRSSTVEEERHRHEPPRNFFQLAFSRETYDALCLLSFAS